MKASVQKFIDSFREPDIDITPPKPYSPTLEKRLELWEMAFDKATGKTASSRIVKSGDVLPTKKTA